MEINHIQFVNEFAKAKQTIFKEVVLGSKWMNYNAQIADVVVVRPSYTRFCVSIYECKVSRADFLSDLRSEKWKGYLDHCHAFYFVVKKGITDTKELPDGVGLILLNDKGFYTRKAPRIRNIDIPAQTLMALIFYRHKHDKNLENRAYFTDWFKYQERRKRLGDKISKALNYYDEHIKKY